MDIVELATWKTRYRKRFLGPGENSEFLEMWEDELLKRSFADADEAIGDVALDPRDEARFPRQHLRILIEHADLRAADRKRKQKHAAPKPPADEPKQPAAKTWNEAMLRLGAIDRKEFDRRERERNRS
jgi:hypothetical protein